MVEKLIGITFPKLSNVLRREQKLTCWRGQMAICKGPSARGKVGVVGCRGQHISGAGWPAGSPYLLCIPLDLDNFAGGKLFAPDMVSNLC